MELVEVVRLLRAEQSDHRIAALTGHNRRTIARYRTWATEQGLLQGPLPSLGALQALRAASMPPMLPPQQVSTVAAYREEILGFRARGMEIAAIRTRLEEQHGHTVSYDAVWRLVRQAEPRKPEVTVRVEVAPGSEAQVDFGYAGLTLDPASGQARKTWVFVLVLSWSRHLYAELVYDQRVETWLLCHAHAFAALGGVPARLVPDNLKSAIVQASFTEPLAQRAYRECAAHYGFLIDPQPPRQPRLKGKVEQGGVHYVKRNFLAGRDPLPTDHLNRLLAHWTRQVAGTRRHGTTKEAPWTRFHAVEQAALGPLPATPYDPATWKQLTVYRDCHISVDGAYYSVPYRLVGQRVLARTGARTVAIYEADYQLVTTHDRAAAPGTRQTILAHLPAEKVPNLVLTREDCRVQAHAIGPATSALVEGLLAHRPEDRLRSAGRVVRLARRVSPARLERACARDAAYGAADYATVKRILAGQLDAQGDLPLPSLDPAPHPFTFARHAAEFVAALLGGQR